MSLIGLEPHKFNPTHRLVSSKEKDRFNSFDSSNKENDIELLEDMPQKDKLGIARSERMYQTHRGTNNLVNVSNLVDDSLRIINTFEEISSLGSSDSESWLMEDNYRNLGNDNIQQQNKTSHLSNIPSLRNIELLFHNRRKVDHRKNIIKPAILDGFIKSLYSNGKINSEAEISNLLNTLDERIENGLLKPRKSYLKNGNEISYLNNTKKEEKGRFKQFIFRYIR